MQFDVFLKTHVPTVSSTSAEAVLKLTAEGATVPFIARYRKEVTSNLDEVQIRNVIEAKEKWDEILKRQIFITSEIEKQGKLTEELKKSIFASFDLDHLEDLYLPFKQKRKTKAVLAKEAGLEPLADLLVAIAQKNAGTPSTEAEILKAAGAYVNTEKKVESEAAALQGAVDILCERLAEIPELREKVRKKLRDEGCLRSQKAAKAKPNSKFENYFDFSESITSLMDPKNSHRYLAMRRGWLEEELSVTMGGGPGREEAFEKVLLSLFEKPIHADQPSAAQSYLQKASRQALKAFVFPSLETEIHRVLKESADHVAIHVFAENVRNLLLASPYGAKAVLGIDPGIRTGCKLVIVNAAGQYVASTVLHIQTPIAQKEAAKILTTCIEEAKISAISIGNGTAGRETETFVRQSLKEAGINIPVVMVNESGASIYSASEVAREEFPDLDVTVRGAISIARRFQDPLAELVKIDPKSIGVGQYQHDVSQSLLKKSLDGVVDSCVNHVGVNLNTASYHLLGRVSGIGPALAKGIVEQRAKIGAFKSREGLLEVPRFSKKAYEQAAGFLRIPAAENPLDNTGVHPEKYALLESLAKRLGKNIRDLLGDGVAIVKQDEEFRKEAGEFTFQDIVKELEKPGRDPREEFIPFQFREDIHEVSDLKAGMQCPGVVTNVTNFGAFVDIGVHQDGLVHISQIADRFVKDPREVVKPGDRVNVRVLEVNLEKKQIALTMRNEQAQMTRADKSAERPVEARHSPRPRHQDQTGAPQRPHQRQRGNPQDRGQQTNHRSAQTHPQKNRPANRDVRDDRSAHSTNDRKQVPTQNGRPIRQDQAHRPSDRPRNDFRNNVFSQFGDLAKALQSGETSPKKRS